MFNFAHLNLCARGQLSINSQSAAVQFVLMAKYFLRNVTKIQFGNCATTDTNRPKSKKTNNGWTMEGKTRSSSHANDHPHPQSHIPANCSHSLSSPSSCLIFLLSPRPNFPPYKPSRWCSSQPTLPPPLLTKYSLPLFSPLSLPLSPPPLPLSPLSDLPW